MTDNPFDQLNEKIALLCARCEYLHSENRRLRQENQQLQTRRERAKRELTELLAALPEYE